MSGLASDMDWDASEDEGGWHGRTSELLFVAVGVSWASLWTANWLYPLLRLAIHTDNRTADYPDYDL